MADLTTKVEILAGTNIADAIRAMIALRHRIGINVSANFNGIHIFICRDDQQVDDLVSKFHYATVNHKDYIS